MNTFLRLALACLGRNPNGVEVKTIIIRIFVQHRDHEFDMYIEI